MKLIKVMPFLVVLCFFSSCEMETNNMEEITSITEEKSEVRFDVIIKLVDEWSGQEIPAGTLPGYGATNLETGVIYFDSRYEVGLFESLPIGTYKFDARDGYFDGASSAIVEVSSENETPEGWIEVTLRYWSE
ncbi:hypothetical protein D1815_00330 [Aquimarina sp. AD1]|uniref:hypothetical protein n=1 Tax=Aquimarina sp. (strain AD1) TaxID=1714848 RepID=UPI000E487D33|nr:hypothetical protein [Aquimarina sp. AD1]AXT54257.1 hypothetical protein D1815_00330 [Aquimarina sp. AD1]RKN16826.1 hypothetical protein D7035_15325 [Aquimarina sp. AD1]